MKIVYCIHRFFGAGGVESILAKKANFLAGRGHEVHIVAAHMHGRKPFFALDPEVRIHDLGLFLNESFFILNYKFHLRRLLKKIEPDVLVSLGRGDVFSLWRCGYPCPKVAEFHFAHDFFRKRHRCRIISLWRERRQFNALLRYDRLVVLTEGDAEFFRSLADARGICTDGWAVEAIPNFVPRGPVSDHTVRRFLCVGRLTGIKGIDRAIRIWKKVHSAHPDWRLDIYGSGPERNNLSRLIELEGLEGVVSLKGQSNDMAAEYAGASGLLATSYSDGFFLAILEAMNAGLPFVSFKLGNDMDELYGKYGFVVEQGDIDAAADCVCRLVEDRDMRLTMGANGADAVAQRFGPEVIVPQWERLFAELVSEES